MNLHKINYTATELRNNEIIVAVRIGIYQSGFVLEKVGDEYKIKVPLSEPMLAELGCLSPVSVEDYLDIYNYCSKRGE